MGAKHVKVMPDADTADTDHMRYLSLIVGIPLLTCIFVLSLRSLWRMQTARQSLTWTDWIVIIYMILCLMEVFSSFMYRPILRKHGNSQNCFIFDLFEQLIFNCVSPAILLSLYYLLILPLLRKVLPSRHIPISILICSGISLNFIISVINCATQDYYAITQTYLNVDLLYCRNQWIVSELVITQYCVHISIMATISGVIIDVRRRFKLKLNHTAIRQTNYQLIFSLISMITTIILISLPKIDEISRYSAVKIFRAIAPIDIVINAYCIFAISKFGTFTCCKCTPCWLFVIRRDNDNGTNKETNNHSGIGTSTIQSNMISETSTFLTYKYSHQDSKNVLLSIIPESHKNKTFNGAYEDVDGVSSDQEEENIPNHIRLTSGDHSVILHHSHNNSNKIEEDDIDHKQKDNNSPLLTIWQIDYEEPSKESSVYKDVEGLSSDTKEDHLDSGDHPMSLILSYKE